MRAIPILSVVLALAAGCGSVKDRPGCSSSADCAAGTYCAHTADGGVCWADTAAPNVSSVAVSCGASPCLRDATLHVTASISDDAEVVGADVTLDLSTSITVAMARSGAAWSADVPLARFPFDAFEREVRVKVTARDGARNTASMEAAGVTMVTRLRFQRELEPGVALTSAAVTADGTVVVAGANHRTYFVGWDGSALASVAVGTLQITAAPLVQGESVWVGSEDGRLYELANSGAGWQSTIRCSTPPQRPLRGALAATSSGFVIGASDYGRLYSANSAGCSGISPMVAAFVFGPVIDTTDGVYAASGTALRRFLVDATGNVDPDLAFSATTVPWSVAQPLAATSSVFVPAVLGTTGRAYRAGAAALEPELLATTVAASSGYAILGDGSVLVPEQNETLAKWPGSGAGEPTWRTAALGANPRTPLVLSSAQTPFVVSTDLGSVIALRSDGTIAWSRQLSPGTAALQPGNIYTPPAAQQVPGATLSTAYFAGADGYLHAVIVDGALDATAPWPKAFHDPRNTNRAGPQP